MARSNVRREERLGDPLDPARFAPREPNPPRASGRRVERDDRRWARCAGRAKPIETFDERDFLIHPVFVPGSTRRRERRQRSPPSSPTTPTTFAASFLFCSPFEKKIVTSR